MNPPYMDLDDFDAFDPEGLEDFDPFQQFIAGSGEVNFEEPDQTAVPDNSISAMNNPASSARDAAIYNATRATRPLNLTNLPRDVQRKIYAMVLGSPTEVSIRSMSLPPHVQDSIVSPINLFLVSHKVHRDAAAVFYGNTKFNMQFECAIGYMTGRMGLDNCREIRDFSVYMQFVWNIRLTIRTVFPNLETLNVLPKQDWYYGAWYDLLHNKHDGYYQFAVEEAVRTSWKTASFGLREFAEMSRHYAVTMSLPFWNEADRTRAPTAMVLTLKYPRWEVVC